MSHGNEGLSTAPIDVFHQSLERDIAEWVRLQSLTQNESVSKEIHDKVINLERQLEALNANRPVNQSSSTRPEILYSSLSNFAWDQTTEFIKLYITVDAPTALSEDNVVVHFDKQSLDVKISGVPGFPNSQLIIKKLNKTIKPQQCKYKVRKNVVSISLRKVDLLWWDDIKYKEQKVPKMDPVADKDAKDPGASLMKLMKNLYDEGDDEMKRTIAKAWTESQEKQRTGASAFPEDSFGHIDDM